jgi:hypothetical protein
MESFKLHFGGWPLLVLLQDQRNAGIISTLPSLSKVIFCQNWLLKVLLDYSANLDDFRDLTFYLKTLKQLL